MPAPSLDTLETPANGQIFALRKPLSKNAALRALEAASVKADGNAVLKIVRERRAIAGEEYFASLICFRLSGPPAFFPNSGLEERTWGFLLLLEVPVDEAWHLGIYKHGAASLTEWQEKHCTALPRTKLAHAFGDRAAVGKLTTRRMAGTKHEVRRASYEAPDLQTSLPMMAASRTAISSVRFDGSNGSFSVTPSTSRVQRSGGRCVVDQLAAVVRLVASSVKAGKTHPFLETFAQAVPLSELPKGITPTSILFDWCELLENDALELRRASPIGGGPGAKVKKRVLLRLLGETIPVLSSGGGGQFARVPSKPLGNFSATKHRYSLKSLLGASLCVTDTRLAGTAPVPLAKWVRESDAFAITFTSPQYFYCDGALFFRAAFAKDVALVRKSLQAEPALAIATSEKGKPLPAKTDSVFPADSIFGIVEHTLYSRRDWLCCADLNDEWADYLCLRDGKLIFIHCKAGDLSKGASCFHEVVGQGLKNLGRVCSTPDEFAAKVESSWGKKNWAGTKIRRLREKGKKPADCTAALRGLLANPDAGREVHLVVTMLSLSAFDTTAGLAVPPPHFVQLIGLILAFIHSSREWGAKPVIVCQP